MRELREFYTRQTWPGTPESDGTKVLYLSWTYPKQRMLFEDFNRKKLNVLLWTN